MASRTKLEKLKEKQRRYYKSLVSVFCPVLNSPVYFTSEGFNHLIYETNRSPRRASEQWLKLMNLQYVTTVIGSAVGIKTTRTFDVVVSDRLGDRDITVIQHTLVHEVEKGKFIRVVVKRFGQGQWVFRSVMPDDKRSKPPRKNKKRHK